MRAASVTIVVAVAVGGCGGGSAGRRATTGSTTSTTASSVAPVTDVAPTPGTASGLSNKTRAGESTPGATPTSAAITATAGGEPQQFQLPSGNIGCYIDSTGVRCDIRERNWQPPARPPSCEYDYGQGIELRDRGAAFVCAGDTTLGGGITVAYGTSIDRGPFRCDSSTEGVDCKDSRSGHGFHLSRASYRIF